MNKKGATTLFTGIMILLLSVIVMIIIIGLITPYFNNIKDAITFKNNKELLLTINEQLMALKDADINSNIYITINPNTDVELDSNNNQIIIRQEINNNNDMREQIYNNLTITKKNNYILFILDLSGIVNLEHSVIFNQSRQIIKVEVTDINNNCRIINMSYVKIYDTH